MASARWSAYSKWDKLELSDDEDTHPGAQFIEANTLRRIKRESHEIKEQERRDKVAKLEKEQEKDDAAFRALEARIVQLSASGDEGAAEESRAELWSLQKAMDARGAELAKLEREKKFNADDMCHVTSEKSLVGSAACKPEPVKELSYEEYTEKHKAALDAYASRARSNEANEEYLEAHPEVLHEHGLGYLLMEALALGMAGKLADMRRVVRQQFHVKSLLDLAGAHKANIGATVRPFFRRLADERVAAEYEKAYEALLEALVKRAGEKVEEARAEERAARAAAEAEAQLEEVPLEQRLGPGGLDPVEVFESLPEPLQAAYEARDTDALRAFVGAMPTAEARVLMRRMVDSGLWVPEPGEEGTLLRGEEAAEGGA